MADNNTAMPWENDPIVQETAAPWESDPIVDEAPKALSSASIDPNLEAPAIVRAQVGALDKPEDRLTAIRKNYPDAQPYDGDNFIMTDPQTGKTMIYNQPGWIPSMGDFASLIPEAGEAAGAVGGAVGGAIGGSAVAPGPGTVGGAIVGAGGGATVGREAAQRTANYLFGNEDTRTGKEQAWDAAKTFAFNAGGEGLGIVAAPLIAKAARGVSNTVKDGSKGILVGRAADPAETAARTADFRAVGVEPTAGMVNGNANTAIREQALAATRAGRPVQDRIEQAFQGIDNETTRIVNGITPQTMSKQELGQALKDQADVLKGQVKERGDYLYGQVGEKAGDAQALGQNTRTYLETLKTERRGMGKSAALNNGAHVDNAIRQTQAIVDDIGSGINFNTLKEARTSIGKIANDPSVDSVLRDRYQGLYSALSKDMGETAASAGDDALVAWRKANHYFRRNSNPNGAWTTKGSIDEIQKAKTPEQAADWVLGQVKQGGTRLNSVRRQIERTEGGADLWNTLTGSTVERMGVNRAGDFSPSTLLSNWRGMSDEAKNALFHGTSRQQYRQDLDRLARVADNLKGYRRLDNHSGTNKAASALDELNLADGKSLLAAVFGGPKALAGMALGKATRFGTSRWQAKLLTSHETVNWLSTLPQSQMQRGGTRAHLARLGKIAASTADNALAVAINDYFREVGYSN